MNYPTILTKMEADLRRCRRTIAADAFSARIREAANTFAGILVGIGVVTLVLRIATGSVPALPHVLVVSAVAAALVLGRALWCTITQKPIDHGSAAERLDLSQSTHNRIATAVDLLRSGDDSEFAKAAIRDGVECLEQYQTEHPFMDTLRTPWRRIGGLILVGLVFLVIAAFVGHGPGQGSDGAGSGNGREPLVARLEDPSTGTSARSRKPTTDPKTETEQAVVSGPREGQSRDGSERKPLELSTNTLSAGPLGQHSSSRARRSQTASNSRSAGSATSGAGAKTNPKSKGTPKRKQPGSSTPVPKEKVGKKSQKGGSINARGSSGSGAMKTSESDSSSKVQARSGDQDDSVDEDEPDEDPDGEKQRLGMQPGLKNRTSRISRELSLSMGKGLDNSTTKGRGGPSPQKKSRGTTTMILGVPVPGFVRGRLLPGSTKSTQEEAEPSSRRSTYTVAVGIDPAVPEEAYQERYRPSIADATQASQYLIDLHRRTENKTNKKKGSDTNE